MHKEHWVWCCYFKSRLIDFGGAFCKGRLLIQCEESGPYTWNIFLLISCNWSCFESGSHIFSDPGYAMWIQIFTVPVSIRIWFWIKIFLFFLYTVCSFKLYEKPSLVYILDEVAIPRSFQRQIKTCAVYPHSDCYRSIWWMNTSELCSPYSFVKFLLLILYCWISFIFSCQL